MPKGGKRLADVIGVAADVAEDVVSLSSEQIASVEEARRSLEFATEQEIDAIYAKYGA